ncbi:hypothetical protein SAMN00120144_3104 [Hymenobacter roseosalivarius DSM 11622]|uniref:Uncharacterized protein n=1 Tax=Hymenobacter roseosalivarius DSM 11622 TaxID=645990 RepID=A0A1W1UDU1_9BACT|nr:hypothetical protein [Hymenobacter roseosalivarius]SMB79276.1 hypothetical protein SAMN00120144_3104 [Hymenobacter roseosalivarius DSM 11622]
MYKNPLFLAKKLAVAGQAYHPSHSEKRAYALLLGLALLSAPARAQSAEAALAGVQDTVVGIVQVIFAIVLIVGLIRVVMKFVQGAPDALGSLGWLVGGVILWFGFQLFKDDLVGAVGGGEGGVR